MTTTAPHTTATATEQTAAAGQSASAAGQGAAVAQSAAAVARAQAPAAGAEGLPAFDRLLELAEGERAVAVRNVPATLACFTAHFPRHPVLPGVLLLESLAALARTAAGPGAWRLAGVRGVRFKHFVGPGDQVHLTVEVSRHSRQRTECRATARVEGRVVATVRALTLVSTTTTWEDTA
ncbi:3-hydroxyacyl-ACP dehydratase FabZ family protein [Streptomyces sp. NPDC059466]|uniref:3-hydroxyacyl-ACP dehydratase FabZ family protein n=1 Tax=Streptomyces sp. NPDC059466 TaxID=3346843 RepID=UPI0036CC26D9